MHLCACTTNTHQHKCTHTHIHPHPHTHRQACTHKHRCAHACTQTLTRVCMCAHVHFCASACVHVCKHTCVIVRVRLNVCVGAPVFMCVFSFPCSPCRSFTFPCVFQAELNPPFLKMKTELINEDSVNELWMESLMKPNEQKLHIQKRLSRKPGSGKHYNLSRKHLRIFLFLIHLTQEYKHLVTDSNGAQNKDHACAHICPFLPWGTRSAVWMTKNTGVQVVAELMGNGWGCILARTQIWFVITEQRWKCVNALLHVWPGLSQRRQLCS